MNMPIPPQQISPQQPQQMGAMPGGTPGPQQVGPVTAELQKRFATLQPQDLMTLDVELSRASPQLIAVILKIFPELQSAIAVLQQMGIGDGAPQQGGAQGGAQSPNPLTAGVSPGLMG